VEGWAGKMTESRSARLGGEALTLVMRLRPVFPPRGFVLCAMKELLSRSGLLTLPGSLNVICSPHLSRF